jgi:hypothetical protein
MMFGRRKKEQMFRATPIVFLVLLLLIGSCRSSSRSDGLDILGPSDETAEAAELVNSANQDLTKIKVLYKENEGKREQLKKALEANDAEQVKKISDDVVYLINDGAGFGKSAIDKIAQAQDMNANEDYKEYLRLKEEALKRQLEAFENYRQAARSLRDNYDPKNAQLRDKVKEEFKSRSENYQTIMEKARDFSNQANELAKEALKKQAQ